ILGIGKGILRVFSSDFPLLGASPIPVICSIILTLDFPLLEAEVALIAHITETADNGLNASDPGSGLSNARLFFVASKETNSLFELQPYHLHS
ncbi:hypothetical protein L208DRAFT_1315968, partial [Tricholoma matsutake]